MNTQPFAVIDILDASGSIIGQPITTIQNLDTTERLDQVGDMSFTIPATEPAAKWLQPGIMFDAYVKKGEQAEAMGRFIYDTQATIIDINAPPVIQVQCLDILHELAWANVTYNREYNGVGLANIVNSLVGLRSGWTADIDSGLGTHTTPFSGEQALEALGMVADQTGNHFRLKAGSGADYKTIEFGSFGQSSGIRAVNMRAFRPSSRGIQNNIAIAQSLQLQQETATIWNKIIPTGLDMLTIANATAGIYPILTGKNYDNSDYYYIMDEDSVAAYGLREYALSVRVEPASTDPGDIINAANALKLAAEAFLARRKVPLKSYELTVDALRQSIQPGDSLLVDVEERVGSRQILNVKEELYVLDKSISRTPDATTTSLTVASQLVRPLTDDELMSAVIQQSNSLARNAA